MRTIVKLAVCAAAVAAVSPAAQSLANSPSSGAMSAFKGQVSCQWERTSTVTTVRCWALKFPGHDAAMSTTSHSGRLASRHWKPPVGPAMVFGHQYKLGNGVTCSFRYRHPTDTSTIRSVICSNAAFGPLIFATPSGLAANDNP
jgi:hypothetical protein